MTVGVPSKYLSVFAEVAAGGENHGERKLVDHLVGTYSLLKKWGNDEHICDAGLFHSALGTSRYETTRFASGGSAADLLLNCIGQKSYDLVLGFARADQAQEYEDPSVAEIATANLADQLNGALKSGNVLLVTKEVERIVPHLGALSTGAREFLLELLQFLNVQTRG